MTARQGETLLIELGYRTLLMSDPIVEDDIDTLFPPFEMRFCQICGRPNH